MMIPMLPMVPPNPLAKVDEIFVSGIPVITPIMIPPIIRDRNGFSLNLIIVTRTNAREIIKLTNNQPNEFIQAS
jgi:hypothetical protein